MAKLVHNYNGGTTDEYGTQLILNRFLQGDVLEGLAVVANGTPNMTVLVQPGSGRITTGTYPSSYGYLISHDTTAGESVTVSTAAASPRIDYIVAYIDKGVAGSLLTANVNNSNNVLKFADVAGTPSGSPVVPTVAQIQTAIGAANPYIILAQVAVAASVTSISNTNITDMRIFAAPRNARALSRTSYVDSGCVWTFTASTLTGAMTAGVVFVNVAGVMVPVNLAAISSNTFTASRDTYIYVNALGAVAYSPVTNGAAPPTLPVSTVCIAVVISGASITSIVNISTAIQVSRVDTSEGTATQTFGDNLATVGPFAVVNVGPSGVAQVTISAGMSNNATNGQTFTGVAISGANTIAPSDNKSLRYQSYAANSFHDGSKVLTYTGLTPGLTKFDLQYRVNSNIGTWVFREITVEPK